jgi:hypothetical protein
VLPPFFDFVNTKMQGLCQLLKDGKEEYESPCKIRLFEFLASYIPTNESTYERKQRLHHRKQS